MGGKGNLLHLHDPFILLYILTFDLLHSAFFLTLATFISAWGKAYKYFSLRAVYVLAILIFEIGSLVCALAPHSTALIIGRAVQGLG